MDKKKQKGETRKRKYEGYRETKTTATVPFVERVSEALSRVFHHHNLVTDVKSHLTLKRMLLHSKG